MDDDDDIPIEYLEPGIYACYFYNHDPVRYNFSHESAVGFMLAVLLDLSPDENFRIRPENGNEIRITPNTDPNLQENNEIMEISDRNYKPIRMELITRRPTKRYYAIITHGKYDVLVQFDTLDFISGFTAYYRDFGDPEHIYNVWREIYDQGRPFKFDVVQ